MADDQASTLLPERRAMTLDHRGSHRVAASRRDLLPTAPADETQLTRGQRWACTAGLVVVVGYLTLGRPFAYLGIAQLNLFLAEILLLVSVVWRETRVAWIEFWRWLIQGGRAHVLCWAIVFNLLYGIFQFARGAATGLNVLDGAKELTLNYGPFFIVLGIQLGRWSPSLMARTMLCIAWVNATYGIVQVFGLSHLNTALPGQPGVTLFNLTTSAAVAILWLAANPRYSRYTWLLLPLNGIVLLGHQVRGEWLSLIVGIVVWLLISRRIRQVLIAGLAVVGLLVVLGLAGITLPSSATRGGNISVQGVVGRAISPFAPDQAAELVGADTAESTNGTAEWRTRWWSAIEKSAADDATNALIGHGYGYQLSDLTTGVTPDIRTPHSIYFYTLGYVGYFGVAVLLLLWAALFQLLWRTYRVTGDPFGIVFFASYISMSLLEPFFETPLGATPTYLFLGFCIAPAVAAARPVRRSPRS